MKAEIAPPAPILRGLREALGMTQGGLAARLGVSRQAVGTWERGECRPRPEVARRLAELLEQMKEAK